MKEIASLAKFITEQGYDKNGNGIDTGVVALLNSLARKPDNLRHRKLLWRKVMPEMIERILAGDPLMPYPEQNEFQGEIEAGFVGIHEPYTKEFRNAASRDQDHSKIQG